MYVCVSACVCVHLYMYVFKCAIGLSAGLQTTSPLLLGYHMVIDIAS